jgi:signal transduction histidine kinase
MKRDTFLGEDSPFLALKRSQRKRFMLAFGWIATPVALICTLIYGYLYVLEPSWQLALGAGLGLVTAGVSLFSLLLARRDKAKLASYVLMPYLVIATAIFSTVLGLVPALAPVYMVYIIVAGMVWGPVMGYGIAAIAAVLWAGAYAYVGFGQPPPTMLTRGAFTLVTVLLTESGYFFVAYVSQAATRGLWRALDRAAYDLIEANRELKAANQHKSRFVARMSHDLRSPLSAVMLSVGLLQRKLYGPLTEKQVEALERVLSSSKRLQTLIDDILDISKLEVGKLTVKEEVVVIQSLVDVLQTTLKQRAVDKGLKFSANIAPDMPPEVVGDEGRLVQILVNLTDNAIKFADEGEVNVLIAPQQEASWRMVVSDTGCGIHESDLELIFEEFRQAESAPSTGKAQGTGLGLAITRHLARKMGGEVTVKSKLGKGTTFNVVLPLKPAGDVSLVPGGSEGLAA